LRNTYAVPETRYARHAGFHIAYQVVGDEGIDIVLAADWFSNVELVWDGIAMAHALTRLASFARLVVFDKRGVGLSDPVPVSGLPTLEDWIEDVRAVMDDAAIKRAALIGVGAGGPMVMQFAATHPHRVSALALINTYARLARGPDYEAGIPDAIRDRILEVPYTDERAANVLAGDSSDEAFRSWWRRYQRHSVSPATAEVMRRMIFDIDVTSVLAAIQAPTLVLHRRDDPWIRVAHARYIAETIPDARLVELPGNEDLYFLGDADGLLDEVEEFLTGTPPAARSDRVLATMLFTDIVESTSTASRLGDRRWHVVMDQHDDLVRRTVERFRGRMVVPTGDGMLALFDGPGRAVGCASSIRDQLGALHLVIRAGVHTGEVEVRGDDVTGIAVNVAARIAAIGRRGEILVSSTVRDLVSGSGLSFTDRGSHALKGVPEPWRLFQLD
jgi:class 3 adenylate cyclase